jgi:hypothetical protein
MKTAWLKLVEKAKNSTTTEPVDSATKKTITKIAGKKK